MAVVAIGCAHYPVNQPLNQVDPQGGYRPKFTGFPGNSENLLLLIGTLDFCRISLAPKIASE